MRGCSLVSAPQSEAQHQTGLLARRADLQLIATMVEPGSRILDLGCGNGELLAWLQQHRQVTGYGLEIDREKIAHCLARGVNVMDLDLDLARGLDDFGADDFDMVVMTETLQAVRHPEHVLDAMLRIAPRAIVTFPNFGHLGYRLQLLLRGRMPVSRWLPYQWYNTPNIHLCTCSDFTAFCRRRNIVITRWHVLNADYRSTALIRMNPNLFGTLAIYQMHRSGL